MTGVASPTVSLHCYFWRHENRCSKIVLFCCLFCFLGGVVMSPLFRRNVARGVRQSAVRISSLAPRPRPTAPASRCCRRLRPRPLACCVSSWPPAVRTFPAQPPAPSRALLGVDASTFEGLPSRASSQRSRQTPDSSVGACTRPRAWSTRPGTPLGSSTTPPRPDLGRYGLTAARPSCWCARRWALRTRSPRRMTTGAVRMVTATCLGTPYVLDSTRTSRWPHEPCNRT